MYIKDGKFAQRFWQFGVRGAAYFVLSRIIQSDYQLLQINKFWKVYNGRTKNKTKQKQI